jgi:hypothetical protein
MSEMCKRQPQGADKPLRNTCGLDLRSIYEQNQASIAMISDAEKGGTAFKVCPQTDKCVWVTANHVVAGENSKNWSLETSDGKKYSFKIVDRDPKNDLAVLYSEGNSKSTPEQPGVQMLPKLDLVHKGDPIVGVGYAKLLKHLTLSPGTVDSPNFKTPRNNEFYKDNMLCLSTGTKSIGGQSGGPAFDKLGRVIGVVSNGEDAQTCYTPHKKVDEFIERVMKKLPN